MIKKSIVSIIILVIGFINTHNAFFIKNSLFFGKRVSFNKFNSINKSISFTNKIPFTTQRSYFDESKSKELQMWKIKTFTQITDINVLWDFIVPFKHDTYEISSYYIKLKFDDPKDLMNELYAIQSTLPTFITLFKKVVVIIPETAELIINKQLYSEYKEILIKNKSDLSSNNSHLYTKKNNKKLMFDIIYGTEPKNTNQMFKDAFLKDKRILQISIAREDIMKLLQIIGIDMGMPSFEKLYYDEATQMLYNMHSPEINKALKLAAKKLRKFQENSKSFYEDID